ncbi:MAG: ZIP family metal transporter [Candidatus Pacebacteria bacterium]|nr:ZIP family metal transporter [Candidatus Paceibacterota bacterium]
MTQLTIMIYGLAIALLSLSGIFILMLNKRAQEYIEKNLITITTFSAGIFFVTSTLVLNESFESLKTSFFLLSVLAGVFLFLLIHLLFKPHRLLGKDHRHKHLAWKVIIGDTLHNLADGLFLVASFSVNSALGIGVALSIIFHEIPQEVSEFFVLKKSGYSNLKAVARNFISALAILVGVLFGIMIADTGSLSGLLLGVSGSFFLGIIFTDLFPALKLYKEKQLRKKIIPFTLGLVFMFIIISIFSHH